MTWRLWLGRITFVLAAAAMTAILASYGVPLPLVAAVLLSAGYEGYVMGYRRGRADQS